MFQYSKVIVFSIANSLSPTIKYEAGTSITLNNGFVSGTNFVAEIKSCQDKVTTIAAKTDDTNFKRTESAIENESYSLLKIYPNPVESNNSIYISSSQDIDQLKVTLRDVTDQELIKHQILSLTAYSPVLLELPYLSSGLYLLQAQQSNYYSSFKLVIK